MQVIVSGDSVAENLVGHEEILTGNIYRQQRRPCGFFLHGFSSSLDDLSDDFFDRFTLDHLGDNFLDCDSFGRRRGAGGQRANPEQTGIA